MVLLYCLLKNKWYYFNAQLSGLCEEHVSFPGFTHSLFHQHISCWPDAGKTSSPFSMSEIGSSA